MASQITSLTIVYSSVYSGADQRKHKSSASLAFVRGIQNSPVTGEFPAQRPITRKVFPFDDVIMSCMHCSHCISELCDYMHGSRVWYRRETAKEAHFSLRWRYNERDGVWNHQRFDCLLNRLFRRRSKKTPKLRVTDLCQGNPPVTDGFPHKGPVTQKMFPFDDVIILSKVLRGRGWCRSHT